MNQYERERRVRNTEFYAAFAVSAVEVSRALAALVVSLPNFLAWQSGDFAVGYCGTWLVNAQMELYGLDKRFSERQRFLIGAGLSLTATVLAETLQLPIPILGTPKLEDIPASVIGIGCSIAVRKLAQRWVNSQVR